MTRHTLSWGDCDCCGGSLPLVDQDNDSIHLPQRLRHGGECPGYATAEGVCGAYEGWSERRIQQYVARRGVAT